MIKKTFTAHPITILFLLRTWWIIFTAPIVRRVLQYFISQKAQPILLSEVLLLSMALVLSVIRWFSTKIIVTGKGLMIKRGFFLKFCISIERPQISSISISKNIFYAMTGCVKCRINTLVKNNKNCEIYLKKRDAEQIYDAFNGKVKLSILKRQNRLKRFLTIPLSLLTLVMILFVVRVLVYGSMTGYELVVMVILCGLIGFYGIVCYYDYKKGKLCLGENVFAIGAKVFSVKEFCCPKNKIATIKISQNPRDRHFNTCKIKITGYGKSGDSVKIKIIEQKAVVEQIKRTFGININA